ncbi:MAG: zf-HC2 domain-containing protein [Candidatus Marinimicrobia bacterium]|nr:zf-HC2 domain-containing protein [Candidatus Neomarinimicrobiota bacterium]
MKCKDYKLLMMDLIYGEITKNDRIHLEKHLTECDECRQEFKEMKQVPEFLGKWEDEPVPIQMTFTSEENSLLQWVKKFLNHLETVKKVGFAVAALLFILALFNTKIEIRDGNFSFEASLFQKSQKSSMAGQLTPEIMEHLKYENFKLTTQLLENYEARDEKKTMMMMTTLMSEIRKERSREYDNLIGTVGQAYETNDLRIQQTNHTVNEILDLINKSAHKE